MNKALIHIDYTRDFVAEDWSADLWCAGQNFEAKMAELTKQFISDV